MNKTFRSVWNARKRTWVAVAEITHAKGKPASGVQLGAMLAVVLGGVWGLNALAQTVPPPNALPTGGQVSAGQASIRQSGAQMVIDQSSDRAAIQWQSFHLGANAQLQFNQPSASSVVLNRVLSSDPSQIFGRISANGQVILTNPQGVYFGPSARVDVGGLIATTHSIGDADFMAGKTRLERKGSTARVVNEGQLKAALGGYIALLAPEVRNEGAVIAQMGTAALAAGEALDLHFDSSNRLVSIRVTPSQIQALVDNRMAVQAPGGLIILSAQSLDQLVGGVVRNSGTVEATGLQMQGGRIVLSGSHSVEHTGTIDASSAEAGGSGGRISLQGRHIALEGTSRLLATGPAGGGTVLVGGDWQGRTDPLLQATAQPTQTATTVNMAQGARIDASATHSGDGGQVVLFSDLSQDRGWTVAKGSLQAEGGPQGGNGGQIETSGHALDVNEVQVSTRAPQGRNGTWLLDPYNITISSGTQTAVDSSYSATGTGATVNVSTLVNALNNSSSVVVSTGPAGSAGADLGDITVSSAISWSSANALTLTAARNIVVNAAVSSTLSGDITFNAGGTVSGSGNIQIGPTSGAVPSPRPMLTLNPGSGSGTLSGTISGYGQLIKTGLGTVQLDGANTYSGGTSIRAGTLAVVGSGIGVDSHNSIHALGGVGRAVEVQLNGTLSLTNVISAWTPMTLDLSGSGNIHVISSGIGKYSNLLTVQTTDSGPASSFSGTVNVSGDGYNGLRNSNLANAVVDVTTTGYGLFMASGKKLAVGELKGSGNIKSAASTLTGTLEVGARNSDSTFSGRLTDTNDGTEKLALTKVGTGTLTLSGTNSYTGTTTVTAGTLLFTQPSALYNNVEASWTASNISVASGATLALGVGTGQFTASHVGRIAALGSASGGFRSGSNVGFDTSAGDFTYGTAVNNTNAGANAIGLTKLGTGKLTLTAGNSNYSGATTVSGGTLALSGSGSVASSSGVALSGAAVFDISATTSGASIVSLSGTSTAATGVALGSKNLTVTNASGSFGGVIGGTGGLILSAGTLTLTGANSYGTTSITGGTLQIGNTGTTGTLGNGAVSLSNNATLSFVRSTGTTIGNTISGVGHVTASITGASSDLTVSSAISLDSGTIDLAADRNLTVSANLNITGAGNITLNAGMSTIAGTSSGGDISVTGTSTISVGASGLARLFTGSIAGSSLTHLPVLSGSSGLGRFRYNSDESITHYSSALGTGLHVIYREAPQITLQANLSKTYDGQYVTSSGLLTAAGSVNVTSGTLYNGDTVNAAAAGATFTFDGSAQQKDFKSGGYTIAGSLTGSSALGYGVSFVNGSLAIAKANLTQLSASKTYDGLSTVSFSQMGTVTGIHGESFTATAGTAVISDKNVATPGKSITDLSGLTLSGNNAAALADNYNLASGLPAAGANNTATIVRANLSLAAVTDTKTYDGTTSSSGTVVVTGKASTDTVSATQAFTNKNVLGAGLSTLQINNGYTIVDGNNADMSGNYTVLTSTAAGTITKANLNLSAVTDTKTYDGTTSSSGTVAVTGKASTDTVTVTQAFANKNVLGAGLSTLQVNNGYTIVDGNNADMSGNYTVLTSTAAGSITKANLNLSAVTDTKTYDGTTSSSGTVVVTGKASTDTVTASQSFANKNVLGAGLSTLQVNHGYTIVDGNNADMSGNYTVLTSTATGTITKANLNLSAVTDTKTYDGTTSSSGTVAVTGKASTDTVTVTQAFANKNVLGAGLSTLQVNHGYTIVDGNNADMSGNYTVLTSTATGTITKANLNLSAVTDTKTYDGTTSSSGTVVVTGKASTDTVTASQSFANKNVLGAGLSTLQVNNGYTIVDGNNADMSGNYTVLTSTASGTITAKALTISGITAANKTYDGNTSASVSTSGVTAAVLQAGGLVANDDVTVSATGSFADKHVGAAKAVALSSSYGGADLGNYTITDQATTTASITPRTMTVSGITASNKTYDSGTTATVSTTAVSFNNLVAGDALTVSATGSFADKHVGAAKTVALSSSYGGADLGNYTITDQATTTASITPRTVTVSGITASNKTYDGGTTATVSTTAVSFNNLVAGDALTVSATGSFADKHVDAAKTVALSSSYGGADAGNYNVLGQTSTTADITAKALTISGITAANKTYDGSTSASVSTSGVTAAVLQAGGLVANDDVTVSATGSFADKHVGAAKTVALSSSYGGADAGNYTITDQATTTASITPRTVTVSGITASNKTYDGGTTATVSTTAVSFNNLVAGDALTVSATGSFADKHVDAAKTVALSSSYGGADLGNYTITDQANASASIMPRALSASLTGSVGKTYDSATTAILSPAHFSLGGFVANEGATVSQTSGTYASANVDANPGSGTVSAVLLPSHFSAQAGTLLSNYILPTAASGNVGLITPAALTLKVNNTSAFVTQDANTAIHNGYSYSGLQGADTATEALVQVPQHADRTYTGAAHPVVGTYTGVYGLNQTPSAKHGNYAVSVVPGDLTVVPADQLLISIASASETYGHRTAANAGAANSVTVQYCLNTSNCNGPNLYSLTMSGNTSQWRDNTNTTVQFDTQIDSTGQLSGGGFLKAGNYSWSVRNVTTSTPGQFSGVSVNSGVLTIDRLTITPTVAAVSKTYDGSTAADASAWATSQIKPGDALSINAGSGSYSTRNVIANDTVTFGSMRLEGADRANYALPVSSVQTSGSITPRAVTVSGITATDKTYDGTTTATVNTAAATFNNLVAGDDLSVSATGAFADKHAGNAKTVSLTSSYSGTDLSNYTITGQTSTTASISPKALTISGITAADKTYDGNAMATVSTSGVTASVLQAGGLVTGDDVSVSATGTFRNANNTVDDKSAGAGKTVALSSRLGGSDAGNYTITGQTRTTASITPRAVTVSGITAANKIYDGTTAATVNTASATFNNLVAGDDLSVAATGVFADMNAGTDKTVSLTSSYSGADLNNYTITDQTSTTASIVYRLAMTEPTQILNPVNLTVRASLLPAFSSSATARTDLLSQLNEGELHKASALSNITTRMLPAESTYSNTPDTPNPAKGSDASQNSGSTMSTSPTTSPGTGAASRNMDAPNRQESSAAPHNATPAGRPSPLEPGGPGASETAPLQIFTVFAPIAGGTDRPFDIPLPSAVLKLLQSEGNVRASLRGMRGLPAWLSFDKEKWVLKAKRVPDNAFPLEVILTAGSKRVMLLVQRSTSRS